MNRKRYHSSYVVDVDIDGNAGVAVLTDSARNRFSVDLRNPETAAQFKRWFATFAKGTSQHATVIEYADAGDPVNIDNRVVRFCNLPDEKKNSVPLNG